MVESKKRVFVDTVVVAELSDPIATMNRLIGKGYTLVSPNTVLDMPVFQENPGVLQKFLCEGEFVIQKWLSADAMCSKVFYWSSCGQETQPAEHFEDAIRDLPNRDGIMAVKELMDEFGLEREDWNPGQWAPPEPLSAEYQETLGLPEGATRTDVLLTCRAKGRMDIFDSYNVGYTRGLATQHHCDGILGCDGNVHEV